MNTIPKENQVKIILSFVMVAIIITLIVVFRESLFKVNENITDSERFYTEYTSVSVNNVYEYVNADQAIELFESEKAIILFGFKECKWCQSYVPLLDEVAKQNGVETIYYCNIKEDRKNNTEEYKKLVEILKEYLQDDDEGNKRIYVPDVYFIKDGEIVGHNNDTSTEEGADVEEYYLQHGDELKEKLNTLFSKLEEEKEECDDSKKGC